MTHLRENEYLTAVDQGDLRKGQQILGEILKELPFSSKYLNDLGVLYFLDKQLGLARVHFVCALIFDPSNELARDNLKRVES